MSAAFNPSTDYVNPAFLTALTAAGIPYTVNSVGSSGSGAGSGASGAGSAIVNISTNQAASASISGRLIQLISGVGLSGARTPSENSPDVGAIFGLHETNEAGQVTRQSAFLTTPSQPEAAPAPCENVSVGEEVTVCAAE